MENAFPNRLVIFEKSNVALEKSKITRAGQYSEEDISGISTMREAIWRLKLKL